jgi:hypothetical protein
MGLGRYIIGFFAIAIIIGNSYKDENKLHNGVDEDMTNVIGYDMTRSRHIRADEGLVPHPKIRNKFVTPQEADSFLKHSPKTTFRKMGDAVDDLREQLRQEILEEEGIY